MENNTNQKHHYSGADYEQSTYWWKIHFIPGRKRDGKGRDIPHWIGYSKWQGQSEAMNPWRCLQSKIIMMESNNLINDAEKIEIHRRVGYICNKKNDPILITLYQDKFFIQPEYLHDFDRSTRDFLINLYKARAGVRTAIDKKFPMVPKTLVGKDVMLEKTGFKDWGELYNYADKLKAQGYPQGAITGYINREMEKLHLKGRI